MTFEDEVDALYAADPDEFVTARQALAKRLRAGGDKAGAAGVAKRRRPTAAAWAVNQLARRHGDELGRLVALGEELGRAHERLLSGDRDDADVASGRRRREAIADLVGRAVAILVESGRAGEAHRDAIASTLDAASLDPEVGAEVVAGRLARELDPPSGFGLGPGLGGDEPDRSTPPSVATSEPRSEPAKAAPKPGPSPKAPSTEPDELARPADEDRARRAQEAKRRAAESRKRAETARTAATRARDLAEQAQKAAEHATREHERLEEEVVRARRTANDARRAARELREAADEAERQAAALEAEAGG